MILKYKYHCDSGLLEAYRSYTLAQNNSLSDTIVITSTASDAEKYNYCLEFICYNSKSIPKAQYISPILTYSEGISFAVPNNLTEFRGHVDMQLTGYDPDDNSIVFKSIAKNCKAFDVEGSLGVLEKDLNDTPNVFTEVMKQLDGIKNVRQDIIDDALKSFSQQMLEVVSTYKWCNVRFVDRGDLIVEKHYIKGSKIIAPEYTLPSGCILVDGWYNPKTESIWDFENDKIEEDVTLYLNYMTEDVVITDGIVTDKGLSTTVYFPEYYQGKKVVEVGNIWIGLPSELHFGNNMEELSFLIDKDRVAGIYFPSDNEMIYSKNGALYLRDSGTMYLIFVPFAQEGYFAMEEGCEVLFTDAISQKCNLKRLVLAESLRHIMSRAIKSTDFEEITLPKRIDKIEDYALFNNSKLKKIYLEGDVPEGLTDLSFVCLDKNLNVTSRPTLVVKPQYYFNYKKLNLAYDVKVLGEEYFDEKYAAKEA